MANTYLTRTTGTPTLGTKVTVSAWVKISEVPAGGGSDRWLFGEYGNNSNHSYLYLRNSSEIGWYEADGSGAVASIITTRLCRDLSGWYHFMIAYDTTDNTQADRFKLYINGERITEFSTNTNNISQNYTPRINRTGRTYCIGGTASYQSNFVGLMSHYHHCDGQALAPTVFGSTDALTGEWKINTSPSFTLGNNGFTILKDGNTITDQSSNSNNFSLGGGTLTPTLDCPSNVFAVWNLLNMTNSNMNFTNGNTKLSSSVAWLGQVSTLAMPSGKYYWEIKYGSGNVGCGVGTWGMASTNTNDLSNSNYGYVGKYPGGYELFQNSGQPYKLNNSNNDGNYGSEATAGDIIMVAFDADNNKLFTGINGTWNNSSDPANGTSPMYTVTSGKLYVPSCSIENGSLETNFGNGYFGTTAVSSAGTNASGNGIFEYDVPAGFTALSTKGLNI